MGNDRRQGSDMNILPAKKKLHLKKFFLPAGLILTLFLAVIVFGGIIPVLGIINQAKVLKVISLEAKGSLQTKDLAIIKSNIDKVDQEVESLKNLLDRAVVLKITPFIKNYYQDGQRVIAAAQAGINAGKIIIDSVEPYQDFLGLKGDTTKSALTGGEKTTEERINFLVESVGGLKPKLEDLEKEVKLIEENISQIDPERYPVEFKGQEIRGKISEAKELITQISRMVQQGKPLIEKADWLLGKEGTRNYLFMFQNDGELRPTGGFWTAYGIIKVNNGKISPSFSEDIYALDAAFDSNIPAPRPIKAYHKNVYYLHLRDINLSPDFKTSLDEFITHYQKIKGRDKFDGVIAIDTQVLVDILKVTGRIGVPGWGNFEADPDERCWGCPQVVYQLEMLADKPLSSINANRKGFISPLMHSILANVLGSPKEQLANIAAAVINDFSQKHILAYFPDENLQKAAEGMNFAGRINSAEGDYFHLNDTNFAGAKSNLFITQEVKQEIKTEGNKIIKKVTINYKNNAPASNCNLEKGDLCLNGLYRNWFRFYVPTGSKLIKMTGSEVEPVVYEELGKTVFEGFYGNKYPLYPQGTTRVSIEYELPFGKEKIMPMTIQKQPGTKEPKYEIIVNGQKQQEFNLATDRNITIDL